MRQAERKEGTSKSKTISRQNRKKKGLKKREITKFTWKRTKILREEERDREINKDWRKSELEKEMQKPHKGSGGEEESIKGLRKE